MKRCRVCKQTKPYEFFSKNKDRADGYSNLCRPCDQEKGRRWYQENKDRRARTLKSWAAKNPDRIAAATAAYKKRHPERVAAYVEAAKPRRREYEQRWYAENLEDKRAKNRQWAKKNPTAHLVICARRRAAVMLRYPPWADAGEIAKIYAECRRITAETGIPHEVDHIIPLQGKMVSGLHVYTNLRVIPAVENRSKHARLDPALA